LAERRIGKRPETVQAIERAYAAFGRARGEDEEVMARLVVLLEFLKELQAIAQCKNLLRQRDSFLSAKEP
jgi:hypothetical protein